MAHLITVTDQNNHQMLFNLDTVVSDILESLDEIKQLANEGSLHGKD